MRKKIRKGGMLKSFNQQSPNFSVKQFLDQPPKKEDNPNRNTLHSVTGYATIPLGGSKTARRLGGLHCQHRRLIAAPLRGVFLCAFNRTHGVSLPKTMTGAPYGNPKGLLFPMLQSANLYGVAHPLGGGVGFTTDNLNIGESHE